LKKRVLNITSLLLHGFVDYPTFCSFVGWDKLPEFLHASRFHEVQDWSGQQLDQTGLQLQQALLDQNEQIPIKMTKALLHATTEKVEEGSPNFAIACTVWGEIMPSILPNLLKMLSYATSFHSGDRWSSFPGEIQAIIGRILTDRFWQNGISAESRDDFVSKVNNTKSTLEGFGSTVRRTVRQIRTGATDILQFFARLGEVFYGIPELAPPLSQALFECSTSLSPHHFSLLISASGKLIKGCPPNLRGQFLPSMLGTLFQQLRIKVDAEWDIVNRRSDSSSIDDNLDDEMKSQSILRSMTYNGAYLMFSLISDSTRPAPTDSPGTLTYLQIITGDPTVLEPVLVFAASALRVRDFHSVKCAYLVLHDKLIPKFRVGKDETQVTCRTSLFH
jgi:exportin-5